MSRWLWSLGRRRQQQAEILAIPASRSPLAAPRLGGHSPNSPTPQPLTAKRSLVRLGSEVLLQAADLGRSRSASERCLIMHLPNPYKSFGLNQRVKIHVSPSLDSSPAWPPPEWASPSQGKTLAALQGCWLAASRTDLQLLRPQIGQPYCLPSLSGRGPAGGPAACLATEGGCEAGLALPRFRGLLPASLPHGTGPGL